MSDFNWSELYNLLTGSSLFTGTLWMLFVLLRKTSEPPPKMPLDDELSSYRERVRREIAS